MGLAISTVGLTKRFGDFTAVSDLELRVREGEVYGLLGPNGAGKTTTIKVLAGILTASSGEAEVLGRGLPCRDITADIGYMPQETALYSGLTVHQNLEFFGRLFGMGRDAILDGENNLLNFIDLSEWKDELVHRLSGGMRHRVSLACALMHNPKLLFLDEPTVGIDPELRVSFWKYFSELKGRGVTNLITTHYMDEARHCDRIGFMRRGRLIAEGSPKELLAGSDTETLEDAFLVFSREATDESW